MSPDAEHLHSLLALRFKARFGERGRNLASVAIVAVSVMFVGAAVSVYSNTSILAALAALYAFFYITTYRFISASIASDSFDSASAPAD